MNLTPRQLRAAAKASLGAFAFIVFSTIYAELSEPFKKLLASTFGHHWVGKGILSIVVFGLVYYYFSMHAKHDGKLDTMKMARNIALACILGGIIIFGFFVWEFLG